LTKRHIGPYITAHKRRIRKNKCNQPFELWWQIPHTLLWHPTSSFGHLQLHSVQIFSINAFEEIIRNGRHSKHNYWTFFFSTGPDTAALNLSTTSVNIKVPENTKNVPSQCMKVNSFLKYTIEKSKLTNFRSVTTSVTVSDVHSVVRT